MKKYVPVLILLYVMAGCSKSGSNPDPGNNAPPISNPPWPNDIQITAVNITYGYTGDIIKITAKNIGTEMNAVVAKGNRRSAVLSSIKNDLEKFDQALRKSFILCACPSSHTVCRTG